MLKKTLLLLSSVGLLLSAYSCENNQQEDITDVVSISLAYELNTNQGQSMYSTKASNAEIFEIFYQKMQSGELTAPSYNLSFVEVNNGTHYSLSGFWADKDLVSMRTGTYQVSGTATAEGDNIQDKCSLTFNETIEINESSSTIVLKAAYDCALIVFSDTSISSLANYNGKDSTTPFPKVNNYFYAFINKTLYSENGREEAYLSGVHTNSTNFKIYTANLIFEKGKYYVFDNVATSYMLPYMEEGSSNETTTPYEAIDLGLSVKWASVNVGASSAEEIGYRFAWGETAPDKVSYTWNTYKWGDGYTFVKYSTGDGKTILEESDDAAHVIWGNKWRMPSIEEALELYEKCSWELEKLNEVSGYRVKGENGNSIFIPCNGQLDENGYENKDMVQLWTSKCSNSDFSMAYRLADKNSWYGPGVKAYSQRHDGLCIRAVYENN